VRNFGPVGGPRNDRSPVYYDTRGAILKCPLNVDSGRRPNVSNARGSGLRLNPWVARRRGRNRLASASHERGDDGDGDLSEGGEIVGDRPQRSIQGRNGRFEVNYWSSKTTWTLGSGAVSMTGALTAVDM
jgi:hypothetical protein